MPAGFNPRPVIAHGAILPARSPAIPPRRFNPRPVIAHGAIRGFVLWAAAVQFQSAPRDCSRGDKWPAPPRCSGRSFNPRPVIAHGAIDGVVRQLLAVVVSIRAP